ncbi:MAG: hypothetical protein KDK65_04070 [Chlamydiia bacterium]|nr:hypothetical protein [Chlamydiia bacterium]
MRLVINAGSSTLKTALFPEPLTETAVFRGQVEWGIAVDEQFLELMGQIEGEVTHVGHRVVHGGTRFTAPTPICDTVLAEIRELSHLATLHNPLNVKGIELARRAFPDAHHYAVFDTAFHTTLPDAASTYPLPKEWRELGVRRYGFHGISHQAIAETFPTCKRLISCHLGNGCSLAAIAEGRCLETTMGFTPLEGLMMGIRPGSLDPAIPLFLLNHESAEEIHRKLHHESGLKGIAGTHDMRTLLSRNDPEAHLALDMFCHRLSLAVGSFLPLLGGLDLLTFTGGIGENTPLIHNRLRDALSFLDFVVKIVPSKEEFFIAGQA